MGLFVIWLTSYMGKLEAKTFGAYTGRFTIDKVCPSRKKIMAFVKNKSKIKNGYQWSDRNNGVKKLCWEQSHKKTFGKGNTCTFIMTMEPDKKIIYGLNCSFNLKRAKVDEKGFQRYVQKMLKQELDINWSPGTVLVRREKKKKDKNNKDTQQYV